VRVELFVRQAFDLQYLAKAGLAAELGFRKKQLEWLQALSVSIATYRTAMQY